MPPVAGGDAATAPPAETSEDFEDYEELTPELVEDEAIRGDFMLRWAVIFAAFLLGATKIGEAPTLVHVKTGQYLASHGVLPPRTDVFSSTATDRPWYNLSWLFDLVVGLVHTVAGFAGLSAFKALLVALTFGLVVHTSRRNSPTWWTAVCGALALLACHQRLMAQPTLITFLGLAVLFWGLNRYRQRLAGEVGGNDAAGNAAESPPALSGNLWWLVPVFVAWGNLDSRAYLGVGCLALYAVGELLGPRLGTLEVLPAAGRRHLLQVTGACLLALLVHPWHVHSLGSVNLVYGSEYPAVREFASQVYVNPDNPRQVYLPQSNYFPVWYGALFENFDLREASARARAAGLAVILAAISLIALNFRRVVWGEALALLGMLVAAALAMREFPAAALVAGIVAALMGQRWYAANCRQEYGTGKLELTWSRGGRAATVAALAALAFFGGTGRLREPSAAQPGFGLDNNLASMVGDLQARLVGLPTQDAAAAPNEPAEGEPGAAGSEPAKTAAAPPAGRPGAPAAAEELRSFDDRPFNFALEHGDVLIWLGQKPFADTRFALYHHRDLEQNLLATHQRVRSVMRPIAGGSLQGSQRSGGARAGGVGGGVSAEDERLRRQLALESRKTWREVLDRYGVTHLLVRLSAGGSASAEYGALCDLMSLKPADFELTDLGAGCAVLYRTDLENPKLQEFLKERAVDFKQLAFQTGGTFLSARSRWVQSPSFYQRYLWSQRREISPAIQQSLQYVRMATLPIGDERGAMPSLPARYLDSRAALALLAVRKAQEGLQDDPDSFWGYRVLGEAYAVLGLWEANYSTAPSRAATGGLRYFQSIAAFNQALVAEPEALDVHELLAGQYARANRIDLELRHQQKMYDILKPLEAEIDAEQMLSLEGRIRELKKKVAAADEADLQYQQQGLKPLERAIQLAQQGFVLKAVAALTEESEQRTGNLGAEQLRIVFQQEAGQVEEAYMNAETFAPAAQESRQSNWQDPVAFANLAHADYPRAQTLWSTKADDVTRNALWSLLTSSVPRPAGLDGWPVATARSTASWYLQRPEVICDARLSIALILLEQGQLASAQREFEQALAANPESPSRNLILYYLGQLRGSEEGLDDFPPSQTVPGLFATGEEFEQRGPIVNEDDLAAGE